MNSTPALKRVSIEHLTVGDQVFKMIQSNNAQLIGEVATVETNVSKAGETYVSCIVLTSGERMTRRGWQSKRLWRAAK